MPQNEGTHFPSLKFIKSLNIKPNKKLGQHFLIDERVAQKIITSCHLSQDDIVIEIGSGLGALTAALARQVTQLVAVEIDKKLITYLQSIIPDTLPVRLIQDSILNMCFSDFIQKKEKIFLLGNIPYSITTPLFLKVFEESSSIKRAVLMIQKEVCDRLRAQPDQEEYGLLAVFCRAYVNISCLFDVPAPCFYPQPKIDSVVVAIEPRNERLWNNPSEDVFRKVTTAAFAHRRKTIMNCLKDIVSKWGIPEELLKKCATRDGLDLSRRGETLTLEEFDTLTRVLIQLMGKR